MAHPFNIVTRDIDAAFTLGHAFIDESNTLGYEGLPASSFEVTEEVGPYYTYYRVAFEVAA